MGDQPHFKGAQLIVGSQDNTKSYDARTLISTLLVYVAKGDGVISDLESNKMIELLSSKMHIRSGEALEDLSSAIMSLANDDDIVKTLQGISQGLSPAEKDDVVRMMLEVMIADEHQHSGEKDAIVLAGQILGVSADAIYAQLRAINPGN